MKRKLETKTEFARVTRRKTQQNKPDWLLTAEKELPYLAPKRSYPIDEKAIANAKLDPAFDGLKASSYTGYNDNEKYPPLEIARDAFLKALRYISHQEFMFLLEKATAKFIDKYAKQPYTIFVEGVDACKSNMWVTNLLILETPISYEYPPEDVTSDLPLTKLVLFADDGLFTGNQMFETIETVLKLDSDRSSPILYKPVVLVAVTTRRALDQLKDIADVIYGDILDTVEDAAMSLGGPHRQFALDGYFGEQRPAVYFDHKVPDSVSVPVAVGRFVSGCGDDISADVEMETLLALESHCPVPPYKISASCLVERFEDGYEDWQGESPYDTYGFYTLAIDNKGAATIPSPQKRPDGPDYTYFTNDEILDGVGYATHNMFVRVTAQTGEEGRFLVVLPDLDYCSSNFWVIFASLLDSSAFVGVIDIYDRIPSGNTVVFSDDFMFTGDRMFEAVLRYIENSGTDPRLIKVVVAVATKQAMALFQKALPQVQIYAKFVAPGDRPIILQNDASMIPDPRTLFDGCDGEVEKSRRKVAQTELCPVPLYMFSPICVAQRLAYPNKRFGEELAAFDK